MKKKSNVIWFYVIIACFSFVVIFGMRYLGHLSSQRSAERHVGLSAANHERMLKADKEKFEKYGVKEDLKVTIQGGEEVNLKEALAGKITVFAQFFGKCPHCEGVNFQVLKKVLETYDDERLQIVTVNVNAEDTTQETLDRYSTSEKWANGSKRWWFANTDVDAFNQWSNKNLGYAEFYRTTGAEAVTLPVKHDMGITVIGPDLKMVNKEDVYSAKLQREGNTAEQTKAYGDAIQSQLMKSISKTLAGEEEEVMKESNAHIYFAVAAGLLVAAISGFVVSNKMRSA